MTQADLTTTPCDDDQARGPAVRSAFLRLLASLWREGGLTLIDPKGRRARVGADGTAGARSVWRLHRWRAVRRMITRGDIGFAEGYVAGDWDTPDLTRLLVGFAANYDHLDAVVGGSPLGRALNAVRHALAGNTRKGSRRNIVAHYDLGNDFYARWLDPGMTYSSALFGSPGDTLEDAQRAKYEALADACDIRPGQRVLEIGCGWGGFAEYLARDRGVSVVAITLSPSQHAYARSRIERAGLVDRVSIELVDYRDVGGTFDRIVSVEMFEAVGEAYWPTFFEVLRDRLTPGGRAALQVITIRHDLLAAYRRRPDFIQMHVFPGGMLPSERRLTELSEAVGMRGRITRRFGADYAETLRRWRCAFDASKGAHRSARFRRLWRYYLSYCEAGFVTGRIDVVHVTIAASETEATP